MNISDRGKGSPSFKKSLRRSVTAMGCWIAFMGAAGVAKAELVPQKLLASTLNYPPYEYSELGEAKGIAVDIIREALERAGVAEVDFNFYPWKRAVFSVQHGQSDLLFNAGKNSARQKWGYFVDSVLIQQSYVLFKRADQELQVAPDYSDSQQLAISVRRGYLYGDGEFRLALDQGKFADILYADSTKQSVDQLLEGRVDVFVGDLLPVKHYLKVQGLEAKIDIVKHRQQPMEVLSWPTYMLFSKQRVSKAFVDQVNLAMEQMKSDGSFSEIVQRYSE